jgi:hypothetical protein
MWPKISVKKVTFSSGWTQSAQGRREIGCGAAGQNRIVRSKTQLHISKPICSSTGSEPAGETLGQCQQIVPSRCASALLVQPGERSIPDSHAGQSLGDLH